MAHFLLINGPNLQLLGAREVEHYGAASLADIEQTMLRFAHDKGHQLETIQSDSELVLIQRIHAAKNDQTSFILINPGAFTHTSVALRDALAAVGIPFIEIHLSNVFAREHFRRHSFFSALAEGVIVGLGVDGYRLALDAAIARLGANRCR